MIKESEIFDIVLDEDGSFEISKNVGINGYIINEVNWRDVPRYKPDGTLMSPEEFQKKIIDKHGIIYFNQNFGNNFIGSSYTLVSSESIENFKESLPVEKIAPGLKIYKKPINGHKYIMAVDPAKDGTDAFAVQITDITDMNFEQVASGQFQIDYLLMPEYLVEWGEWYNFAFMIIENNEGAGQSIADTIYKSYDYENLYFDVKADSTSINSKKFRKRYPGFRTTPKSRKLILTTLKMFIENNKFKIHDKKTIDEFSTFILINGKYQADDGCHDDAIMSLAITFAPFCNTKNFIDMKNLIDVLYKKVDDSKVDLTEVFSIGGFFDDGSSQIDSHMQRNTNQFGGVVPFYDTMFTGNF